MTRYVAGWACIPYFLAVVLIAYLVILNLFVALLLSNFSGVNDGERDCERGCVNSWRN